MSGSAFHHLPGLWATAMTDSECVPAHRKENKWVRPLEEVACRNNLPRDAVGSSSLEVLKMLLNEVPDNII